MAVIDANRGEFGVEPICTVLRSAGVQVAPSTYYAARKRAPPARAVRFRIGTADAVARAYGCAAAGGRELGLTAATLAALATPAPTPSGGPRDKVLHVDSAFSLGYCKPVPHFRFGSSDAAFGTPGLGGSFGFADPDTGTGFAYVMNRMGFHRWSDPRELAVRQALFGDALGARAQT